MPCVLFPTAIGPCSLAWNGADLTAFALPASDQASTAEPAGLPAATPDWVRELVARVERHLGGEPQDFTRRVYEATRKVPAGRTCTYGELAGMLGEPPGASRAIGALLGANPWPLIVPCHRIVGAKGRLTGFSAAGGVRTKARLLAIEGAQLLAE